jgi:hypothetical protein
MIEQNFIPKVKCVFVGQTYARESLKEIINIIINIKNTHQLDINVYYYGSSSLSELEIPDINKYVTQMGWIHPSELVQEIRKYDLAILPYFDNENKIVSELSFPSKMVVYSTANLPILFIGNNDSSPAKMIREYSIGRTINRNNASPTLILSHLLYLSTLKEVSEFKNNSRELNNLLFSRQNLISEMRKIDSLGALPIKSKIGYAYGSKISTKKLFDLMSWRDSDSVKLKTRYFVQVIKFLSRSSLSPLPGKTLQDNLEIIGVDFSEFSLTILSASTTNQIQNLLSLQVKPSYKIRHFGDFDNFVKINKEKGGDGLSDFVYHLELTGNQRLCLKKMWKDNFFDVLNTIKMNKNINLIVNKNYLLFKSKNLKLVDTRIIDKSDAYLLALLGYFNVLIRKKVLFDILKISGESLLNPVMYYYHIFNSVGGWHLHDPFMFKGYKINYVNRFFSLSDYFTIFNKFYLLENKSAKNPRSKFDLLKEFRLFLIRSKISKSKIDYIIHRIKSNGL